MDKWITSAITKAETLTRPYGQKVDDEMKYVWIFDCGQPIDRAYTTKKGLVNSLKDGWPSVRFDRSLVFDKAIERRNKNPDNIYEDPFIGSINRILVIHNPGK